MKKIETNKMESINGGLKCLHVGALTVQLSMFGLGGLMYAEVSRCWNSQ